MLGRAICANQNCEHEERFHAISWKTSWPIHAKCQTIGCNCEQFVYTFSKKEENKQ